MQGDHGYKVVQQVPIFCRAQEDFQEWWMRFKGHAETTEIGIITDWITKIQEETLSTTTETTNAKVEQQRTRLGRIIKLLEKLIQTHMTNEASVVGAGLGSGFETTEKLHTMKYLEAMLGPDQEFWKRAVRDEYKHIVKNRVFKAVSSTEVSNHAKIMSSTWNIKKKLNGVY